MTEIENIYSVIGGRFISSAAEIQKKLGHIKAIVFDWDGVFNNGTKQSGAGSSFSEVDSMGTNLLRFSWFLKNGTIPLTAILSGEKNETAFYFSKRECLNYSFYKFVHKIEALDFLCEKEKIDPSQVVYFFDDVLDIPIAEKCGLRILINQKSNPLFTNYCLKNKLVDYLTASQGGQFAVRESTELLIALNGNYDAVINNRKNYDEDYKNYINQRKQISPEFYTLDNNKVKKTEDPC
jgi:3-deoxy-D-manno-octulosonate 8-phosphate phosphatase (KDO 8-P phosphatase)